jgi:hypothetical protein
VTRHTPVDDTLRSKSSEAAVDALRGAGFVTLANSAMAAQLTDLVENAVKLTPRERLASASSGSGIFAETAQANVNRVIGALTPDQQAALKAGINPADQAAVLAYAARIAAAGGATLTSASGAGAREGGSGGGNSRSSGSYGRELGAISGDLGRSYNALLGQGYSKAQLDAVMPYARELGWHNRQDLRALADAGKDFSGLAAQHEQARKRGDKAGMERIEGEMQKKYGETKDKKARRGMLHIFRKQHINVDAQHRAGHTPPQSTPQAAAEFSRVGQTASNEQADAKTADWGSLEGMAARPVATAGKEPAKEATAGRSDPARPKKPPQNTLAQNGKAPGPKIT